jgi:predicted phage terminase large subunit-like protein
MKLLLEKISEKMKKDPSLGVYQDMYSICCETMKTDISLGVRYLVELSEECERAIWDERFEDKIVDLFAFHKKVLLKAAPHHFESFLLYIEWNREPAKKFYPPRRKVLKQVVDALQELEDDKLDLLAISLPPGSGKTTLAIFYLTWLAGKHSDEPMLTGSHSNSFVRGVYDECLRILDAQGEYLWHDVFPAVSVSNTNAKDCRIDLGKRKRFETLEFTSIGTGNAGLYRASRLLYCDDLVSGIEVALSKERLDKLWETYTTDLRQRKIGDHCKELHIATRWSVHDVIGRLESDYGDSDRAKFIVISALDENDESNFDYAYGVGFNTKFYHEQRNIMDDASWRALYMNEPIEREGLLYHKDELRRYFELPDGDPDAVLSICDTKDKGTDFAVMPIAYKYGEDYYIEKIICDNSNPEVVETRLVMALLEHKVQMSRFESNSAGGRVAQKVQEQVKAKGGITKITTKYTTANKETKIIVNSPWVKEHCLFKDDTVIGNDKEYKKALNFLCTYTMAGKNKKDDVPDGFAMLSEFCQSLTGMRIEVFQRPF